MSPSSAILLLQRNAGVSPLFPLLICIYPIFETLFSMYRRKVIRGRPAGLPDGVHLHRLIYRRLMRWAVGNQSAKMLTRRNSMTSPYLWLLCMLSVGAGDALLEQLGGARGVHRAVRRDLRVPVRAHRAFPRSRLADRPPLKG